MNFSALIFDPDDDPTGILSKTILSTIDVSRAALIFTEQHQAATVVGDYRLLLDKRRARK